MKNLTLEQNINQIVQNNIDVARHSIETKMGRKAEDIIVMPQQLLEMLRDVVDTVRNTQVRESKIHLYGLTAPVGITTSDFGDFTKSILVDEVPFQTIEGMRDELVDKLLNDYEVYVYTLNKVTFYNPTMIQPEVRYYMRYKCFPRSEWSDMVRQAENHQRNHEWLNHWMDIGNTNTQVTDNTPKEEPKIGPLVVNGQIKKLKF